jgi:anhydro-N-acetylmuramic acid kinase
MAVGHNRPMIVAGVMSGTSADGVNVALVRLQGRGLRTRLQLLAHGEFPYPPRIRSAVLAAMNSTRASVADLARLNFRLAEVYADAVRVTARESGFACDLIGCHGQTIYHQGDPRPYLGRAISATWQTGEGSVLAERLQVPVVSDFRPADMAAGGKGAPLVPFLDYLLFRHARRGRILQNIGGIGNLTAIPAGATPEQVIAFDTGPGNMVIDALAKELFGKPFDRDGALAARGMANRRVLAALLRAPFFRRTPPRTAGREQFGREFVSRFLRLCRGLGKHDMIATATALTAESIAASVRTLSQEVRFHDFFVSGGGTRNGSLMRMLADRLAGFKMRISTTDEQGLPSEAKEAVAFAVLAYQTWHRQPSNVPSATGAVRPAILGKLSYV